MFPDYQSNNLDSYYYCLKFDHSIWKITIDIVYKVQIKSIIS